ncbi:MAG: diheme cytochrome c [Gammaproteobacteria bacterium]|nr:diheme cytochrome c [Gammaproteobacteria bacterium]MDH5800582.1 diheme cytochrome c [Gammaproteobacteria bacterium]
MNTVMNPFLKNKAIVVLLGLLALGNVSMVAAEEQSFWSWFFSFERMKEVEPMNNATYKEECGSCHFAYPAGLLPQASWEKLLDAKALADHFGENAELDEAMRTQLLQALVAKSAEKSYYKRSKKVMASLDAGSAPKRITEVPYIKEKHEEVKEKVKSNKKIKSMSFCDKCHQKADEARFDDDTVVIPEYGVWTW